MIVVLFNLRWLMSFSLNEKLKIKQCCVYIANAGDQLPCLLPGGALLPQLRDLIELTWLLKVRRYKICNSDLIGCFVLCILCCKI